MAQAILEIRASQEGGGASLDHALVRGVGRPPLRGWNHGVSHEEDSQPPQHHWPASRVQLSFEQLHLRLTAAQCVLFICNRGYFSSHRDTTVKHAHTLNRADRAPVV